MLQSDSTAAVGALRKGRSSKRPLLKHCRRLAALTLAEQLTLEARWVPTAKNMADGPSRGRGPAPCGDDLDGIYEGLQLTRRERRAIGRFSAELQRQQLVKIFEAALLAGTGAGTGAGSTVPLVFRGLF